MNNLILSVLKDFNAKKIRYAILRNYEFLYDASYEKGYDFDMVVDEHDAHLLEQVLVAHGFTKYPAQFSKKHQGYGKYLSLEHVKVGFDVQKEGVHWNDIAYLKADSILSHKIFKHGFYVLSDEDSLIMYICHSILGKRFFKEKYKREIAKIIDKTINLAYVEETLSSVFNKKISKEILKQVKVGNFKKIENKAYWYAFYFVIKRPAKIPCYILLSLRWLFSRRLYHSYPLISFIGPDGAGKTTAAESLVKVLEKNNRKVKLIYAGRGKSNFLPIKAVAGAVYKKVEEEEIKKKSFISKIKPLLYIGAAPLYTLDLYLRYLFVILPARKKGIVVTDRYGSDILLMEHVPLWLKRILLFPFPKPTLCFYLYNDPKLLYERRKQQSPQELERQMSLFSHLVGKFSAISIRTTSQEKDMAFIEEKVFEYMMKRRY